MVVQKYGYFFEEEAMISTNVLKRKAFLILIYLFEISSICNNFSCYPLCYRVETFKNHIDAVVLCCSFCQRSI